MIIKAEHTECPRPSTSSLLLASFYTFWVAPAGLTSTSVRPALTPPGHPASTYVLCETRFRAASQGYIGRKPGNYGLAVGGGGGGGVVREQTHSTTTHHPLEWLERAGGARSHTLTLDSSRLQRAQLNSRHFHVSCL